MDWKAYREALDALSFSPDFRERTEAVLRRRAQEQEKERSSVKFIKKPVVAAAVAALLVVSASAVALRLSASQVAERTGRTALAAAFEDNNAVAVNETVQTGDYAVTLMGLTSGANLDELNADLDVDHTYAVVALERLDGAPMGQVASGADYTVTPLVSGYDPWAVNNWTLGCSVDVLEADGTWYFLLDAGQLGAFADHTVYLAFYEGAAPPSAGKFTVAGDGSIAFAQDYPEEHALFVLPLDESLADPAAAQALVEPFLPGEDTAGETPIQESAPASDSPVLTIVPADA